MAEIVRECDDWAVRFSVIGAVAHPHADATRRMRSQFRFEGLACRIAASRHYAACTGEKSADLAAQPVGQPGLH
jgi:hypothetical protein